MTSTAAPVVESIAAYPDGVEVRFTQYMKLDSINAETVTVSQNGAPLTGSFYPMNAESSFADAEVQYASVFRFVPNMELPFSGDVTVEAANVQNYAGTRIVGEYESTVAVEVRPETVGAEEDITLEFGESKQLTLEIKPAQAGANKTLHVSSFSSAVVSVAEQTVTTDTNGKATITIKGELPGATSVAYSLDGTDLSGSIEVCVNNVKETCAAVTASVESGDVNPGTMVTLFTTTVGASIYYTTDGSCPCIEDSPTRILYTEPIKVTKNVRIIAYAVKEGCFESQTTHFDYKMTYTPGDINGDGTLNNKDLNRLMKHLAGEEVKVVEAALDINGDGTVNNKDLNRLMKYLAGEDVELY